MDTNPLTDKTKRWSGTNIDRMTAPHPSERETKLEHKVRQWPPAIARTETAYTSSGPIHRAHSINVYVAPGTLRPERQLVSWDIFARNLREQRAVKRADTFREQQFQVLSCKKKILQNNCKPYRDLDGGLKPKQKKKYEVHIALR